MAVNHLRSKLKRKKWSVDDDLSVKSTREKPRHSTAFSIDVKAETQRSERSEPSEGMWWNREQTSGVESLWALTLKSALCDLESEARYLVPDLPSPSSVRVTALKSGDPRWCDLSEKVAPFPAFSAPPPRTSSSPVRLGSSQQNLSARLQRPPDAPEGLSSSDSRRSIHRVKTPSPQAVTERARPSHHSWEQAAPPKDPEHDENEEEEVRDGKEEEEEEEEEAAAQKSDGAVLRSCPMCLLAFPAGSTQMDCDGHLAQCLSDMNVDVTW